MDVVPLPPRGEWLTDVRSGRALRVSWHTEEGVAVLSTWRDGTCVSSVHLDPEAAAALIGLLAQGLASQADVPAEVAETA